MQSITKYLDPMRPIDKNSPYTTPLQIRFTEKQLAEIDLAAEQYGMSRSEIIRLSCAAGLVALKDLGADGLAQIIANSLKVD